MDKQTFDQLMAFVPALMRDRAVIAGGYAVDADLATDIDIFILNCVDLEDAALKVVTFLEESGIDYEQPEAEVYGASRMLAATIPFGYAGKNVQIIVTGFTTAKALVNSFDLSVHALATYPSTPYTMTLAFGSQWTPTGKCIHILRWDTPIETQERFKKLALRYGGGGDAEELNKLRGAATAERIKRLAPVEDAA
jgi:hypothetical protein